MACQYVFRDMNLIHWYSQMGNFSFCEGLTKYSAGNSVHVLLHEQRSSTTTINHCLCLCVYVCMGVSYSLHIPVDHHRDAFVRLTWNNRRLNNMDSTLKAKLCAQFNFMAWGHAVYTPYLQNPSETKSLWTYAQLNFLWVCWFYGSTVFPVWS